jgi:hypothetical protein
MKKILVILAMMFLVTETVNAETINFTLVNWTNDNLVYLLTEIDGQEIASGRINSGETVVIEMEMKPFMLFLFNKEGECGFAKSYIPIEKEVKITIFPLKTIII